MRIQQKARSDRPDAGWLLDEDAASAVDGGDATIFSGWIYDHLFPHAARSRWLTH
jgi:hypothetical protein